MEKIAVVMLAFNKIEYTKKCVDSVYLNTDKESFHYIMVDNGSEDGTADYFDQVKENNGNVTVIKNPVNLGFGQGANIGMQKAIDMGFNYICLLNNDIEVLPKWLSLLYEMAVSDEKIGMVQSSVLDFNDNPINCGINIDLHSENYLKMVGLENIPAERLYLNGASMLIKKKCLDEVGLFSPEFFPNFHEETDLCIQAQQCGWKLMFCRESKVHHHEAITNHSIEGSESLFWKKWDLLLNKHAWYFHEKAEEKFGIDFLKFELEKYGKHIDINSSSKDLAKEWNLTGPKTKEQIDDFYKNTSGYMGDLILWNNSEYKKQLINHVIYASKFFKINSLLDIGAGILSDTIKIRNSGISVTSIDFDSEHYRFGQWKMKQRRINDVNLRYVGDFIKPHDAIIMFDVIEHVKDPDKFLDYYASMATKTIFMTVPENIPPDENERHPMHLIEYADFWKTIPQYLEQKHGFKRIDSITFTR